MPPSAVAAQQEGRLARTASGVLLALAVAGLLGRTQGIPVFATVALASALVGLGLALASATWTDPRADRSRAFFASIPCTIGLLAALVPLTSWSPPAHAGLGGLVGLALALFLQSTALLLLPQDGLRVRHLVAETCAAASLPISVAVLVTHARPSHWLYASLAAGLTLSGAGILALRPREGHLLWLLRASPARALIHGQLLAMAVLLPLLKLVRRTVESHAWFTPSAGDALEVGLFLFVLGAALVRGARRLSIAEVRVSQAEAEIQKQQARFRRLIESDVMGVMAADGATGQVQYANAVLLRMLGYTWADLTSGRMTLAQLTPDDCRAQDEWARAEMKATGGACTPYEKVYLHRDGTRIPVLVGFAYVDATRAESIGFVLDIRARKAAEDALQRTTADLERRVEQRTAELAHANARLARDLAEREAIQAQARASDERLRAATRSAFDPIVTVDSEGRVIFWNPAAESMFGYAEADILGHDIGRLVPPGQHAQFDAALARMRSGRSPAPLGTRLEVKALRRDGQELDIELSLSEWSNQDGRFYSAIVRDITQRKAIEQALTLARDQAELASRYKSAFLANMSHEIRTPMNVLLGMSELLAQSPLTDEQARYAKAARQAGEHLIAVIDDVLDFSKVESGHFVLEEATFDPREVVEQTIEFFWHRAHQKQLALAADVEDAVPARVLGDAHRLRQVLVNLVGNAVKFTEQGGVTVEVRCKGGDVLYVAVHDTGMGVAPDKHESIFEAFTQGDASMTRKHGGTGLGLSISKRIVERMGGRMWLDSRLGHGSTFQFTAVLPAQPAVVAERLGTARHRTPSGPHDLPAPSFAQPSPTTPELLEQDPAIEVETRLRTGAVLVADSNAVHRRSVRDALHRLGARVEEAEDVDTCLRMLDGSSRYAFVIVDAKLPGGGGLGLAQRVRQGSPGPWPEFVLARADEDSLDVSQMQRAGVWVTLRKPIKRTVLADALAAAVQPGPLLVNETKAPSRALRILVVDDAEDNRMLVRAFLHDLGWHLDEAENGAKALEMWSPGKYDVLLMDVQMPVMDGYTATGEIRRLEREGGWVPMPIVALTAHALPEARAHSLEAGCTEHVTKPFRRGQLVDLVRSLAGPGRARPSDRTQQAEPWRDEAPTPRDVPLVVQVDEVLQSLVPGFLDHRRSDVQALREAVARVDFEKVRLLGHSMKGSGGSYGFDAITDLGRDLENAAMVGDARGILEATDRLERYLAAVVVVVA